MQDYIELRGARENNLQDINLKIPKKKMLRAERKVTRRQLADALGVHYQTIGYLERGEFSPSLYLALRIAEYFELPVEAIFSIKPFPLIGDQGTR